MMHISKKTQTRLATAALMAAPIPAAIAASPAKAQSSDSSIEAISNSLPAVAPAPVSGTPPTAETGALGDAAGKPVMRALDITEQSHDIVVARREEARDLRAHARAQREARRRVGKLIRRERTKERQPVVGAPSGQQVQAPQGGQPSGGQPSSGDASVSSGTKAQLDAIAQCESGGNPGAVNPSGQYKGLFQFDQQTWESVGGQGDPAAASEGEQYQRAAQLMAQRGSNPWPVCGS